MIEFSRSNYDTMVEDAYRRGKNEACGILGGRYEENRSVVTRVEPGENIAEVPEIRYRMDPEEQLEVTEAIEAEDETVVGFYHSHPTGPTMPSETDADRATWPDHSYVIVALDGYPYVGSWRWRSEEGTFEQEIVRVR